MSRHSVSIEGVEQEVSTISREIAARRTVILGLLTLVLTVCVGQGWIDVHTSSQITDDVIYVLGFLGTVGAGLWIRKDTTPSDPKLKPTSTQGEPLLPASQALVILSGSNVVPPNLDHLMMDSDD